MYLKNLFWKKIRSLISDRPNILYPLAFGNALKSESLKPVSVQFNILKDISVGKKDEYIEVPFDQSTLATLFIENDWHTDIIEVLESHVDKQKKYSLVDIGANIGLFSRQLLNSDLNLSSLECIEPDKDNFRYLLSNLNPANYSQRILFHQFALADNSGSANFYKDLTNVGNYSLNPNAVLDDVLSKDVIKTKSTREFFNEIVPRSEELIVKLDTQGLDEMIVCNIPESALRNIRVLILEVWGIGGKNYDEEVFRKIIESFDKIYFGKDALNDTQEVIDFSRQNSRAFKDLICIK